MPFRFKYDKPVLFDLADPTATGSWDCNATGSLVGLDCTSGPSTGGVCASYGATAGGTCSPGYNAFFSMCYSGAHNAALCSTGTST
jgi:hypothetical protein